MANLSRKRAESDPIRSFDPFRLMRDMMRWDPFGDLLPTVDRQIFAPTVEVRESQDEFLFCADLPGVKKDDLDVSVTGNRLTISGKRESDVTEQDEADRYYAYERSYGTFSRSFTLPEGADLENLDAELKDGVLRIAIPKRPEVQTKKIDIKASESAAEVQAENESQKGESRKSEPEKSESQKSEPEKNESQKRKS